MFKKVKFILMIILLVLCLYAGFEYYNTQLTQNIENQLKDQKKEYLASISKLRESNIELYIKEKKNRILDFSSDGKIKQCMYDLKYNISNGCNQQELSTHLIENKINLIENLEVLSTINLNNTILASTNYSHLGITIPQTKDRTYLIKAKENPYFQELFYSDILNKNEFVIAAPVTHNDELVGIIAGVLKAEDFYNSLKINNLLPGNYYIVNSKGQLVNPSKHLTGKNKGVLTQIMDTENYNQCHKDILNNNTNNTFIHKNYEFIDYRGVKVLGTHDIIEELNWCILSEMDLIQAKHKANNLEYKFLSLIVLSAILFYFMGRYEKECFCK